MMDPAGLLISIAATTNTLNRLPATDTPASQTLSLIKSQIKILETGAQRIHEWLHFTEPSGKAQVMPSLLDAVGTVDLSLQRLQNDMMDATLAGPQRATSGNANILGNERSMKRHLTDLRQCSSLVHYTLNVCQQPAEEGTEHEVRELELGTRILRNAQSCVVPDQRRLILNFTAAQQQKPSVNYSAFMKQVLDAEADRSNEVLAPLHGSAVNLHGTEPSLAKTPLNVATGPPTNGTSVFSGQRVRDRSELHLPTDAATMAASPETWSVPSTPATQRTSLDSLVTPASPNDREGLIPVASVSSTVTAKSLDRNDVHTAPHPPQARPRIARKAVSGPSVRAAGRASASTDKSPYIPRSQGPSNSPADSAFGVMEKVSVITRSLSSLNSNDYLSVEREESPVQPYADSPPVYSQIFERPGASSRPHASSTNRRNTARSSQADADGPHSIRLVREDRVADLRKILEEGYNANEIDDRNGRTAIMEASRLRRWDACRILLQSGARLHLKDTKGETALHFAAREGDAEICRMLLGSGAIVEDCNAEGQTPLELAAAGGHTETVLCLINAVSPPKANHPTFVKAFLESVKTGDVNTAQMFLANNVKPKKMKESWKPLAYAAQSGSLPMLELMLAQKCSVKDRSPAGWTALHFAARHGHLPMAERLLALKLSVRAGTKKTRETPLHVAAAAGHTATALALLAHKDANAAVHDAEHLEPIHHAIRNGDIKLTASLIDEGAKLSNASRYGWKPIHLAAANGHVALLAECMTRGVSIEEKLSVPSLKPDKHTNEAARRGYWTEIRWPHPGARPLHLALEFGHDDVAHTLISGGAKVNEGDSRGWRPLHYAAFHGRPDMVQLLLAKGATPDATTSDGHTAVTLGFREYGLHADHHQRMRILEMLQTAMAGQRKSKFKSLTSLLTPASSQSRSAAQRNLAWHTAQMAEALYREHPGAEGEDEEQSIVDDDDDDDDEGGGPQNTATTSS